jgi:hypothetical protein
MTSASITADLQHKGSTELKAGVGLVTLVAVVILALVAAAPALAIVPVAGPLPPATQVTINNEPGNQTDPHVSGDLVAYFSDVAGANAQIRYFDFASGADTGIPNAFDFLPDVSGSIIVFTRITTGKSAIFSFDVATGGPAVELDPKVDSRRRSSVIGDATVAWVDFDVAGGEVVTYDRTAGTTQRLTNNTGFDRRPNVSPDGNVIVWENKPALDLNDPGDIYKAVKTGGAWTVSQVTSTPDNESWPDTNGTVVVYSSNRSSSTAGADIYWTDLATGAETQLALNGEQSNPSISRRLIVFESMAPGAATSDIFAYDLSTTGLYQLTSTPGLTEALSDASVSPAGQVRVVWSVFEQDENVYGLSFQLPAAVVPANVAFDPGTLNLKSKGAYVSVCLEFPTGRNPADVDVSTVTLLAIAPVTSAKLGIGPGAPTAIGDCDGDSVSDLTVKFDRASVQSWFSSDVNATVRAEGRFKDGTPFRGDAPLRVINSGITHTNETNPGSVTP